LKQDVTVACIQMMAGILPFTHVIFGGIIDPVTGTDKLQNLALAREKTLEAAQAGAGIVVLPECFNSPYGTAFFPQYAETLLPSPPAQEESPSFHALSRMAAEAGVYLVGGSIPESDQGKYYNTCLVVSPKGKLLATHRKIHLVDIDIPGKATFQEPETISSVSA